MPFDMKMIPDTYEVIKLEYIDEIKSDTALLKHKKTGAKVAIIANDDPNKVFNIGFKTPPTNSTGVPHIMEHSVLCGSKHFPAKDPFIELAKGSLNTFLNAMTYPDKTIYPIASCNDVDFQNLMHVYLDAVFYPNIYEHDEIFRQEGWHYEIDSPEGELTYNGVVYNEMKGAFSAPEDVLYRKISETLYPDTTYSVESGGDPDAIPDLSYEEFLDFHRKYYHPSNCFIYLYGDMDMAEKLNFIHDHYLKDYDYLEVDSSINMQAPFDQVVIAKDEYPISDEDDDENAAYMAYSWSIGSTLDPKLYNAFAILEYLLMEAPGAPLKQALLDAEYGEDIYGQFETSMMQPYLSVMIKNMDEHNYEAIMTTIQDTLKKIASDGLDQTALEGALNYYEFKAKEADFGRWPKGLMYGLQMLDSWLYDEEKPFVLLAYQEVFDFFRSQIGTGYFESLIEKYMINNTHASVMLLVPSKGLAARREQALADKLSAYKASLGEEELLALVEKNAALKQYQSEPSPKEIVEMIPLLSIKDIKREAEPIINEVINEEVQFLLHDIETNGINYVDLLFDLHHIPEEDVPYLGILAESLRKMDTESYSYQELTSVINLHTGGITTDVTVMPAKEGEDYLAYFVVSGKALAEKTDKLFELESEILRSTSFADEKRLREILNQLKSRMEMSMMNSGHSASVNRATSYFARSAWYKELTEGIAFYQFISDILEDFDGRKAEVIAKLSELTTRIFVRERVLVDWTATKSCFEASKEAAKTFARKLYSDTADAASVTVGLCPYHNEAFTTSGMVLYNAACGNFTKTGHAFSGSMNVLKNVLGNEFLWTNIRVKGGAYGAMCGFALSGNTYFVSYRDPNLAATYEVYAQIADYVSGIELDERELTKYIIGAAGQADTPMTPSMKGARSRAAYLGGHTIEEIQKNRDQMLGTTAGDLQKIADSIKDVIAAGHICCVGSESLIMKDKERFDKISALIR